MQFEFGRAAKKLESENSLRAQKAKQRLAREREENKKVQQQIQVRQEEQRQQRLRELEAQEAVRSAKVPGWSHPTACCRVSLKAVYCTQARLQHEEDIECGGKRPCGPQTYRKTQTGPSSAQQTRCACRVLLVLGLCL